MNCFNKFKKFLKKHKLKLMESEKILYSEKGFAGTLMRGVGAAFGPVGAVVGNVAAGASGADYW